MKYRRILFFIFVASIAAFILNQSPVLAARCIRQDFDKASDYAECARQEAEDREVIVPQATAGSCTPGGGGLATAIFVPWYKYLPGEQTEGKCSPVFPKSSKGNYDIAKGVPLILFAIIELLLRISGLIAVGYIIYGSIQYITSQGMPENLKGAKSTITNAITGLIVVMLATGLVQFIGNAFK